MNPLFLIFQCFCYKDQDEFQEKISYILPYVSEDGKSQDWLLYGDYAIKQQAVRNVFTSLTYKAPGSSGGIISKAPIGNESFVVTYRVKISSRKGASGGGMAFWISESNTIPEDISVYGRGPDLNGVLVVVNLNNKHYVAATSGNISYREKMAWQPFYVENLANNSFTIKIEQKNGILEVSMIADSITKVLYKTNTSPVKKGYYIGVSANNGQSSAISYVYEINSSYIKRVQGRFVKGEGKKSSMLVWLALLGGLGAIGYYLYTVQVKPHSK